MKSFQSLKVRLSKYIRRETVAAARAASVAPMFEKGEKEKGQDIRPPQPQVRFARNMRGRQENMSKNSSSPAPPQRQEQSQPTVWIRLCKEKDPNPELNEKEKITIIVPFPPLKDLSV